MDLGLKIKTLRKEMKLTQADLAKKVSISRSYLADIERNRYNPSVDTLTNIAKSLGISLSKLVDENMTNEKNADKKNIENNFPIIPEKFTDPEEARTYVMKHQIFAYGGFYPEKMSDEDILNFANEMIEQSKLIRYKYESKNK
ncbi:helix-turn-helix transcriptional regulator [Clostridium botulinum]|uniref:helix-turn-helix domain-containing protein n=1 Tax=Clostridium botulinum TaxID=1491 RepID=UPI00077314BB|nr:helix-turn-helix transcriptional regulator [Clostridium botulinum]NFH79949.1 helix-turn-helix transcriptional regulator [Clostridium botulinum]NFH84464.1 helix-turn-helix transcriptional regulator [Clostridium botulinum]NFI11533.1 helix-turn-helix transcriptional regulator [Clostridium botulinum]NFI14416.1 helix-turn-helix transcriptional regulator [Clostridium botulinum]NFO84641.1 helix-turn-helix transcriptional regulator [Clostridium botulinum]